MRVNGVGRSVVVAITQTPASGPPGPVTTPPTSSLSIATEPLRGCARATVRNVEPAASAAASTPAHRNLADFIFQLLSGTDSCQALGSRLSALGSPLSALRFRLSALRFRLSWPAFPIGLLVLSRP